jgi:ATP-dependent RNA helicase SUPV3L1/SUV3
MLTHVRKIKRMIFESLHKFNGKNEIPLPLTQVKQIAGRAGRFGMHKKDKDDDSTSVPAREPRLDADRDPTVIQPLDNTTATTDAPGGSVTTLHKADLPLLRGLLPLPLPSIPRAAFDIPRPVLDHLAQILPSDVTFSQLQSHASALALLPAHMRAVDLEGRMRVSDLLEPYRAQLTMDDLVLLSMAPVNVRDPIAVSVYTNLIGAYVSSGMVDVRDILLPSGMIRTLENVELTLSTLPPLPPIEGVGRRPLVPPILVSSIPQLETLHKSLVAYIWLSFRLSIAFPDRVIAQGIKERVEAVLEECLKRLPGLRQRKTHERGKEVDGLVAKWRREHVEPNGRKKGWGRYSFEQKVQEMEEQERERGKLIQWQGNRIRGGGKGTGIWSRIGHVRSKV